MRMEDVSVGRVYVRGYHRGRHGVTATTQRVMVDATYVTEMGRSRADRVQVHNVSWDEEAEQWNYTGSYDSDGNPFRYLLMARELLTIAEVEEQERERKRQEEIRDRRKQAEQDFRQNTALEIAMRIGAPLEAITVSVLSSQQPDPETGDFKVWPTGARITGSALEAMLESDPDPEIVAETLREIGAIEKMSMSDEELAERIVGALRSIPEPVSDPDE